MIRPTNGNARRQPGADTSFHYDAKNTVSDYTSQCGKAAAVSLYCHGILTLDRAAAMFARNPAWWRA